jgi:hypothetical protein
MHKGNLKSKPVKGLYEYLIDLSQTPSKIMEEIQSNLKSLLGDQWLKVFIPHEAVKPIVPNVTAVTDENRTVADQLVDDFIADLTVVAHAPDSHEPFPDFSIQDTHDEGPFQIVSSTHDQLDDIVAAAATESKKAEVAAEPLVELLPDKASVGSETASSVPNPNKTSSVRVQEPAAKILNVPQDTAPPSAPTVSPRASISPDAKPGNTAPSPISPADFRIKRDTPPAPLTLGNDVVSHSKLNLSSISMVVIVVLIFSVTGVIWYKLKPESIQVVQGVKSAPPAIMAAPVVDPLAGGGTKSAEAPVAAAQNATKEPMPSFIPVAGHDRSFSSTKPGWERYVGTDAEYRVFRSGGKLKAIQVLSLKGGLISEGRLQSIIKELAGTDAYRITSLEQKYGFQVSRATIHRKADLLIYRKESAIHAFVVSLDS